VKSCLVPFPYLWVHYGDVHGRVRVDDDLDLLVHNDHGRGGGGGGVSACRRSLALFHPC